MSDQFTPTQHHWEDLLTKYKNLLQKLNQIVADETQFPEAQGTTWGYHYLKDNSLTFPKQQLRKVEKLTELHKEPETQPDTRTYYDLLAWWTELNGDVDYFLETWLPPRCSR